MIYFYIVILSDVIRSMSSSKYWLFGDINHNLVSSQVYNILWNFMIQWMIAAHGLYIPSNIN